MNTQSHTLELSRLDGLYTSFGEEGLTYRCPYKGMARLGGYESIIVTRKVSQDGHNGIGRNHRGFGLDKTVLVINIASGQLLRL